MNCGITSVLLLRNSLCDIMSMVILPNSYQFLKGGSCHLMLAKMVYFRVYCVSGQI